MAKKQNMTKLPINTKLTPHTKPTLNIKSNLNVLNIIYTTLPSQESASSLAQNLLQKKYIACATLFPTTSMYGWKGQLEKVNEWILLCKTLPEKVSQVRQEIEKTHPYETPCILVFKDLESNSSYFVWACASTQTSRDQTKK
ncbi:divalent-cation tolerance protein CutA [Candidatus Woesearchaeota archaeon]|nr:divalent-cation tolerance protein CutA [Candidatus Woesearchaeota archaeon]